jgi:D-galactarolactone cycloisomerase
MPVARYVEHLTPCVYLDEIITQPFRPDGEGFLTIPDRPGLGIELNRETLKRLGVLELPSRARRRYDEVICGKGEKP